MKLRSGKPKWCRNILFKGLFSCPVAGSHPVPAVQGTTISVCWSFQGFYLCLFHIETKKKIFWTDFIKVETSGLGVKIAGCVPKAEHILLLLVLFCKSIRCSHSLPPWLLWHWFAEDMVCVRVPAWPCPASLPALLSSFNREHPICKQKGCLEKQCASGIHYSVKHVSNSKSITWNRSR